MPSVLSEVVALNATSADRERREYLAGQPMFGYVQQDLTDSPIYRFLTGRGTIAAAVLFGLGYWFGRRAKRS
jgi:hypothetical protein